MAIRTVITRGYGTFGTIANIVLRGYTSFPVSTIVQRAAITMTAAEASAITMTASKAKSLIMTAPEGESFAAYLTVEI
jgi:hypothetical protein